MIREIIKNEDQLHNLKLCKEFSVFNHNFSLVKHWEENRVERLYSAFIFASILAMVKKYFLLFNE